VDYEEKRLRKKLKAERYKKLEAEGQILYGMGGKNRLLNTEEARGKQRKGFKRHSVRQKHRLKKEHLWYHRNKKTKIYCWSYNSYLRPSMVNRWYNQDKIDLIMEYFYKEYRDIDRLLSDYNRGYKDPLFVRFVGKSGILYNPDRLQILKENYEDILMDAIVNFMSEHKNYLPDVGISFHQYMYNIIPYRLLSSLLSFIPDNAQEYIDVDDIEDKNYAIERYINPLGIHIINNFKKLK
jgi:hypothetical protein